METIINKQSNNDTIHYQEIHQEVLGRQDYHESLSCPLKSSVDLVLIYFLYKMSVIKCREIWTETDVN